MRNGKIEGFCTEIGTVLVFGIFGGISGEGEHT
jgi:hypothetical protein